ncbi:phosphatase PAP2 family protein [Comamonas fluminis]|uniref:phosphatase PAP2 family protein n=1 Tax=Comamonas fluminis TaxID=2796366 RepID=UPI001C44E0AB|nr:phosphatase PAP2 family protein [Comamonas fluminis]
MTEPVTAASQPHKPHPPSSRKQRGFVFWAVWVLIASYAVYPTANWLASLRDQRYDFITRWDAMIPLVPEFIFVYFSFFPFLLLPLWLVQQPVLSALGKRQIAGTLICGLVFVLFPANLAFERVIPDAEPYRSIFSAMFFVDKPHNLLPSLHIVYTALTCLAICQCQWGKGRVWLCLGVVAWSAAICASTMLVHQHHVLDVVTALVLVAFLWVLIRPIPLSPELPQAGPV